MRPRLLDLMLNEGVNPLEQSTQYVLRTQSNKLQNNIRKKSKTSSVKPRRRMMTRIATPQSMACLIVAIWIQRKLQISCKSTTWGRISHGLSSHCMKSSNWLRCGTSWRYLVVLAQSLDRFSWSFQSFSILPMQRSSLVSVLFAVGAPLQNIWPTRRTSASYNAPSSKQSPWLCRFGSEYYQFTSEYASSPFLFCGNSRKVSELSQVASTRCFLFRRETHSSIPTTRWSLLTITTLLSSCTYLFSSWSQLSRISSWSSSRTATFRSSTQRTSHGSRQERLGPLKNLLRKLMKVAVEAAQEDPRRISQTL